MTGASGWQWEYDPGFEHVAKGLPDRVVAEVERLAGQLVDLAEMEIDVTDIGEGPRPGGAGGVRRLPPSRTVACWRCRFPAYS